MGLLRVLILALFSVFAVFAGVITAAAIALATAFFVVGRNMLRPSSASRSSNPQRLRPSDRGEVIDISATEVAAGEAPADSSFR